MLLYSDIPDRRCLQSRSLPALSFLIKLAICPEENMPKDAAEMVENQVKSTATSLFLSLMICVNGEERRGDFI